jgi:hypothetical protein
MADTALTKAIQKIKVKNIIEIHPYIYREAMNDVVKILTDLLPYERETIEAAYIEGDTDGSSETMGGISNRNNKGFADYFTKTYNQ